MERLSGKVAWFNSAKGYGFLTCEGRDDVFVHYSAIVKTGYKTLEEGQEVDYQIAIGSTGKNQAEVVVVSKTLHPVAST